MKDDKTSAQDNGEQIVSPESLQRNDLQVADSSQFPKAAAGRKKAR